MEFPPFEHLHFYEDLQGGRRINIGLSDIAPFPLSGLRGALPKRMDLNWVDPMGMPELRGLIARQHGLARDRVLVTTGATEANFLVNAALVRPGDRVVADAPMYSPLRDCPRGFGAEVTEVNRDCENGWALDLDAIRKAATRRTRLLVFANLGNPTAAGIARRELQELLDVAEERDAYVLVDETFRHLAWDRVPPSVASLGPRGIAVSTVSKLYGLGVLRVGWTVAAPEVLERVKCVKDYTTAATSAITQALAAWALRRHDSFLRRARRITHRNRGLLREALRRMPALRADVGDAGNVVFPHTDADVDRLDRLLVRKYRTLVAHGRFFARRGMGDHFRIGLGGDSYEFRAGLRNLRRALEELT